MWRLPAISRRGDDSSAALATHAFVRRAVLPRNFMPTRGQTQHTYIYGALKPVRAAAVELQVQMRATSAAHVCVSTLPLTLDSIFHTDVCSSSV